MGSWKLVLWALPAPVLLWFAVYGGVSQPWASILAAIAGVLLGYMYGTIRTIERLHKHIQGYAPDSKTTDEILDRIL